MISRGSLYTGLCALLCNPRLSMIVKRQHAKSDQASLKLETVRLITRTCPKDSIFQLSAHGAARGLQLTLPPRSSNAIILHQTLNGKLTFATATRAKEAKPVILSIIRSINQSITQLLLSSTRFLVLKFIMNPSATANRNTSPSTSNPRPTTARR